MVKKDCYWASREIPGTDDSKMVAICTNCAEKLGMIGKGWFWKGSVLGYGDYDLRCFSCDTPIFLRNHEQKNPSPIQNSSG